MLLGAVSLGPCARSSLIGQSLSLPCMLLVLLCLPQGAFGQEVPCPTDCQCKHDQAIVDCSNGKVKTVPERIPGEVQFLSLDNIPIRHLSSQALANLTKLKHLSLQNCDLSSIAPDAFNGLESLDTLVLSMNNLSYLPDNVFPAKEKMSYLLLSFNQIQWETIAAALSGLTHLLNLDVSHTKIREDDQLPESFVSLKALKTLKMEYTTVQLSSTYFTSLSGGSLETLSLVSCNLLNVTPSALAPLTSLRELDMSRANIQPPRDAHNIIKGLANATNLTHLHMDYVFDQPHSRVDKSFFQDLEGIKLRNLTFVGNSKAFSGTIPHKFFKPLQSVEEIYLNECGIHTISESAFQSLKHLKYLSLRGNLLTCYYPDECGFLHMQKHGMENLETLDLSWNNLQTETSYVNFKKSVFKSLKRLLLKGNKLIDLSSKMFNNLEHLQFLDLSQNPISSVDNDFLWRLPRLYTIQMNETRTLGRLEKNVFQGASDLRNIHLEGGNIEFIHPMAFKGLTSLQTLKLRNNDLDCDSVKGVKIPSKTISLIDIGDNFFACVPEFISANTGLQRLYMDHNGISDVESPLAGLENLTILDLSHNEITYISRHFLTNQHPKLEKITLEGNPFHCGCDFDELYDIVNKSSLAVYGVENHNCLSPADAKGQNIFVFHPSHWECKSKQIAVPILCVLFSVLTCVVVVFVQKSRCQSPHVKCSRDCLTDCYLPLKQDSPDCVIEDSRL